MPRSRRIPGDIGWRPEPDAADRAGVVEPGLILRLLSVVGFFVAGVTGVIALVGWALVFVVGLGDQPTIWGWARGRPAGEVVAQVVLVVLLGVVCAGVTLVAMWAAWRGLQASAGRRFWVATQAVVGVVAVGLVVVDRRYPAALEEVGVGGWEWWLLSGVVALALVTAHLRMRRAGAGPRPDRRGAG